MAKKPLKFIPLNKELALQFVNSGSVNKLVWSSTHIPDIANYDDYQQLYLQISHFLTRLIIKPKVKYVDSGSTVVGYDYRISLNGVDQKIEFFYKLEKQHTYYFIVFRRSENDHEIIGSAGLRDSMDNFYYNCSFDYLIILFYIKPNEITSNQFLIDFSHLKSININNWFRSKRKDYGF